MHDIGFLHTTVRATITRGLEQLHTSQTFQQEEKVLSLLLLPEAHQWKPIIAVLVVIALILALGCLILGVLFFSGRTLGRIIEAAIEKHAKEVIGVDVTFKDLQVALYTGKLWLKGLTIQNPAPYSAPYLLEAKEVLIDINVSRLLLSSFKHLEFQSVVFKEVDVIWEKSGPFDSNIKQTLEFMEAREAREKEDKEKESAQAHRDSKKRDLAVAAVVGVAAAWTTVEIDQLTIEDVGVKMALAGMGTRVALADIKLEGFAKDQDARPAHGMVSFILHTFLKTVLTNTMGKHHHLF